MSGDCARFSTRFRGRCGGIDRVFTDEPFTGRMTVLVRKTDSDLQWGLAVGNELRPGGRLRGLYRRSGIMHDPFQSLRFHAVFIVRYDLEQVVPVLKMNAPPQADGDRIVRPLVRAVLIHAVHFLIVQEELDRHAGLVLDRELCARDRRVIILGRPEPG